MSMRGIKALPPRSVILNRGGKADVGDRVRIRANKNPQRIGQEGKIVRIVRLYFNGRIWNYAREEYMATIRSHLRYEILINGERLPLALGPSHFDVVERA